MIDRLRLATTIVAAIAAAAIALVPLASSSGARAQTPVAKPADAAASKCDRGQFRVFLDVGHTPEEGGAVSARGVNEYEFNLVLAKDIEKKLLEAGFGRTLLQVTTGEKNAGLVHRVVAANRSKANLLLSVHHDSVPDRFLEQWEYEGKQLGYCDRFKGHSLFVSYVNPRRAASLRFARLLGKALKARGLQYTPHYTQAFMGERRRELVDTDGGVYRFDQLYVLRATGMPAVLMEAGSIINRDEELALASEARRALIAASVVDAVTDFCAGAASANMAGMK
jgi:N-acetylmuramoyl-L-alanine amidase